MAQYYVSRVMAQVMRSRWGRGKKKAGCDGCPTSHSEPETYIVPLGREEPMNPCERLQILFDDVLDNSSTCIWRMRLRRRRLTIGASNVGKPHGLRQDAVKAVAAWNSSTDNCAYIQLCIEHRHSPAARSCESRRLMTIHGSGARTCTRGCPGAEDPCVDPCPTCRRAS